MNPLTYWHNAMHRLDKMPQRERGLMLIVGLSVLAAVELLVVMPMHTQRLVWAEMNTVAQQSAHDSTLAATLEQQRQEQVLSDRLKAANEALRALGVNADSVGTRGESLSFLLSKTLLDNHVQLVALRALNPQAMSLDSPAEQPGTNPTDTPEVLFRHRYVLTLRGDVFSVAKALDQLQIDLKPLKLERLSLRGESDGVVLATLDWSTIGLEKSWLSL